MNGARSGLFSWERVLGLVIGLLHEHQFFYTKNDAPVRIKRNKFIRRARMKLPFFGLNLQFFYLEVTIFFVGARTVDIEGNARWRSLTIALS